MSGGRTARAGAGRSGWAAGFWRTTAVYTAAGPRSPCLSASSVHLRAAAGPLVLAVHATPSGKSSACALPARSVHLHRHICAVYRAYIYSICVYIFTHICICVYLNFLVRHIIYRRQSCPAAEYCSDGHVDAA